MKNFKLINGLVAILVFSGSAALAGEEPDADGLRRDMSYFFGYSFGNILKEGGNDDIDLNGLMEGFKDSLNGQPSTLSPEAQQAVVAVLREQEQQRQQEREEAMAAARAQQEEMAKANLAEGQEFLEENAESDDVVATESGLQYQVLEEGSGEHPKENSVVKVHYEGKLIDGRVFDSSIQRGEPVEFPLNQVIPGWTEGLQLMKEGGKTRLYIPPDLAYGPGGTRGIPPNSVLIFDVELLEVKPPKN